MITQQRKEQQGPCMRPVCPVDHLLEDSRYGVRFEELPWGVPFANVYSRITSRQLNLLADASGLPSTLLNAEKSMPKSRWRKHARGLQSFHWQVAVQDARRRSDKHGLRLKLSSTILPPNDAPSQRSPSHGVIHLPFDMSPSPAPPMTNRCSRSIAPEAMTPLSKLAGSYEP